MKTNTYTLIALLIGATQAAAHEGGHVHAHPHGAEGLVLSIALVSLVAGALVYAKVRRK